MDAKQPSPTINERWYKSPKKLAIAAAVLIAVFLLGYVPSCIDARMVRQQNAGMQYHLKLANLRGQLGMMSNEANRNNFGRAADLSTEFFDGVRKVLDNPSDERIKAKLQGILSRRDEVTTDLAQANPAVKSKLSDMYADLSQGVSESAK